MSKNETENDLVSGVTAHLKGDIQSAKEQYLAVLKKNNKNAVAHNNLGFLLARENKTEEAIEHIKAALEINPDMGMAHSNMGQLLVLQGESEKGKEHLEKAVSLESENAVAWHNLARYRMSVHRYEEAEYAWIRASNIQADPLFITGLGSAVAAQKRFDEATALFQNALDIDPNFSMAWSQLGTLYMLREDYGSAKYALNNALAINPHDVSTLSHMGLLYAAVGQKKQAAGAFSQILELDPQNAGARLNLAIILLSSNDKPNIETASRHLEALKKDAESVVNAPEEFSRKVAMYLELAEKQLAAIEN